MKSVQILSAAVSAMMLGSMAHAADVVEETPLLTPTERALIMEGEFWGGYLWRGGDAINDGGGNSEDEDFGLLGGGLLVAIPLGQALLLQLETDGEYAFSDDGDDNYGGSVSGGGHFAWTNDRYLIGAFGGGGWVDVDDEASFGFGGLEGRVNFTTTSFALQGGYIVGQSDDEEVIDNTYFIRGIGQVFINDGRTMLQGELAYAWGDQDVDSTPDDIDAISWGVEIEHAPNIHFGRSALSLFAGYEGLHMVEDSGGGSDDEFTDHAFKIGLRLRFGAETPMQREMGTAPDLPNVARWVGETPAID